MNAEEIFINSVTGLKPDSEKHNFKFNYEPVLKMLNQLIIIT